MVGLKLARVGMRGRSLLLLAAAARATGLLLSSGTLSPPPQRSRSPQPMAAIQMEKLTIMLVGCSSGVGVGLDDKNCVDMLTPDKPAESELKLGDRVLLWNGIEMIDFTGERRLLKDVVVSADTHTLVIERQQPAAAAGTQAQGAAQSEPAAAEPEGGNWKAQTSETWKSSDAWAPETSWGGDTP